MTGWGEFYLALAVFLLSHVIPVRPPVRPWLVAHLGLRGYIAGYSMASIAVLTWLIIAAARAPYVEVIPPLGALRWVPLIAMPLVCALAVAGLGMTNPLSLGGRGRRAYDPDRPGVLAVTRHPLLLAAMIWALAHLLANGDLAHVILFGLLGSFALLGMMVIDRRNRRQLGDAAWQALARNTAVFSLSGLRRLSLRPWVILATAALYAALLGLHMPVIGVSPLP